MFLTYCLNELWVQFHQSVSHGLKNVTINFIASFGALKLKMEVGLFCCLVFCGTLHGMITNYWDPVVWNVINCYVYLCWSTIYMRGFGKISGQGGGFWIQRESFFYSSGEIWDKTELQLEVTEQLTSEGTSGDCRDQLRSSFGVTFSSLPNSISSWVPK